MTLSKEAEQNKPKRPINAYFKFRTQKLQELKDHPDKVAEAKRLWDDLSQKKKTELSDEYHKELDQYKVKVQAWKKKYGLDDDDLKKKSKKKRDQIDDEDKKPIKTKGAKETKDSKPKEAEKKKEEPKHKSAEKDKAKSKKDGEKKKGRC